MLCCVEGTAQLVHGGADSNWVEKARRCRSYVLLCRLQGRGIPEAQARVLFQQLMVAVDYCHSLGIANRDIKVSSSNF